MHVILQTNHSSFSINAPWPSRSRQRGRCQLEMVNKLLIQLPYVDDQRPTGTFALALELDALRERTHVRNPNPGRRRDRLAGAVHRDDRYLDPGTGKFVTVVAARSRRVISTSIMPLLGQAGPVE